jgi:RNA polymerase sigma-70 factor (ECF subfamily)
MDRVETFNEYRPLLFSIAYRMLGSATEAEDILQEAYLRWQGVPEAEMRSPRSFLSTIVTRLCIDELRSARARRVVYVGPWLPEPLQTSAMPEMTRTPELAETLRFAFLLLLENLSPVERAVFLLREVFDYEYAEIAEIVGKSEANCRQMVSRSRKYLKERRPRFAASREEQERVTQQFIRVCEGGDMQGLISMLAPDVKLASDGGGKVAAARNVISGPSNVARFIFGVLSKLPPGSTLTTRLDEVNGRLALINYLDGTLNSVITFECDADRIYSVNVVANPDKLRAVHQVSP